MTITVANFITQYLRPVLASTSDYTDAILGYWITQALQDISRSFPWKTYALWDASTGHASYNYSDSTTAADETNIIRLLTCSYPWVSADDPGIQLIRRSHFDSDFEGANYYEPDNDFKLLWVGPTVKTGNKIYADCHVVWDSASGIANPPEHYALIVLWCRWQAAIQQVNDAQTASIVNPSLINSLALEARRAEIAYRAAYEQLDQAKATSGIASGWSMDKWDQRAGG